jgi:hypothetical protein
MSSAKSPLLLHRCFHHENREASAQCPECRHYYCRECITEHDDKVICAACLSDKNPTKKPSNPWFVLLPRLITAFLAFFVIYLVFYSLGQTLASLPDKFHNPLELSK